MQHPQRSLLGMALLLVCLSNARAQDDAAKTKPASASKTDHHNHSGPKHAAEGKNKAAPEDGKDSEEAVGEEKKAGQEKNQSVYSFGLPTADGKNMPLSEYKGKVLLVVNLGRESTYAAQLQALEKLNDTFKDKGLVVLGVPSNDFGNAEPGTPADVAKFYADAKVNFPVMQVSTLTGVHELPVFNYLAKSKSVENDGLHWNYTKFLVDRKGKVIVCFPPDVAPDSLAMMATVQEALDGTWKPKKHAKPPSEPAAEEDDAE